MNHEAGIQHQYIRRMRIENWLMAVVVIAILGGFAIASFSVVGSLYDVINTINTFRP